MIQIRKVGENHHGNEYICRKQFPAINVQATCNADELFTSVSAEWPGSVHDSRIWRNSHICGIFRTFDNAVLLGDQGYGIEKCLMVPFREPRTAEEVAYNNLLKHDRVIIERCFGQLKQRFPLLQNTIRLPVRHVPSIMIACCVLHNIGKYLKDEEVLVLEEGLLVDDDNIEDEEPVGLRDLQREGQVIRNHLATIIYANQNH